MRELAGVAEAIDTEGTALDLRHDPGDENYDKEGNGLADDPEQWWHFLYAVWIGHVELMADAVRTESNGSDHRNEYEQTPAGAQAVLADEDVTQSGRPRWYYLVDGCRPFGVKRGVVFNRIVQSESLRVSTTIKYTEGPVRLFHVGASGRDPNLSSPHAAPAQPVGRPFQKPPSAGRSRSDLDMSRQLPAGARIRHG